MTEEIYAAEQGTPEISEPETEVSEEVNTVEEPEVTEQASELPAGKSKQDAAFAQMRRENEELRRRAEEAENWKAEMEAKQSARTKGIASITGGDGDVDLQAIADSYGVTVDELNEAIAEAEAEEAREAEQRQIAEERDHYKELYEESELRARSESDIARIKKAFPEEAKDLNTFEDLARTCGLYMNADSSLTPEEAFATHLTVKARTEQKPPREIGKVGPTPDDSGWLSRDQVMAMSEEEQEKNYELILKSRQRW